MGTKPTAAEIRDYLEGYIEIEDGLISDTKINNILNNFVIKFLERKIGTSFTAEQTLYDYYDGNGENYLILNRKIINSIVKVEYIDSVNFTRELTLVSFTLLPDEGILKGIRTEYLLSNNYPIFPRGNRNIKVTFKTGYATTAIPDDIVEIMKCFTCEKVLAFLEGRSGGGDIAIQGYSKSYGKQGKYTNIRNELARYGYSLLTYYLTGVSS